MKKPRVVVTTFADRRRRELAVEEERKAERAAWAKRDREWDEKLYAMRTERDVYACDLQESECRVELLETILGAFFPEDATDQLGAVAVAAVLKHGLCRRPYVSQTLDEATRETLCALAKTG